MSVYVCNTSIYYIKESCALGITHVTFQLQHIAYVISRAALIQLQSDQLTPHGVHSSAVQLSFIVKCLGCGFCAKTCQINQNSSTIVAFL